MMNRTFVFVLILILGAVVISGVYYYKTHQINYLAQLQQNYVVKTMRILPDNQFEFVLENQNRILGCLRGEWVPEAKTSIIQLMNSSQKGRIVILQSLTHDNHTVHVVDVYLTLEGNASHEINLWKWLQQKKLVYQKE